MKNDMKLIIERWDKYKINEQEAAYAKELPKPDEPIENLQQLKDYLDKVIPKDKVQAFVQKNASYIKKAVGLTVGGAVGVLTTPLGGTPGVAAGVAAGAVADKLVGAFMENALQSLSLSLMSIKDSDRASFGDLGNFFDIDDKVLKFLKNSYGGKVPPEVLKVSEDLKNEMTQRITRFVGQGVDLSVIKITDIFNIRTSSVSKRLDNILKTIHSVQVKPTT